MLQPLWWWFCKKASQIALGAYAWEKNHHAVSQGVKVRLTSISALTLSLTHTEHAESFLSREWGSSACVGNGSKDQHWCAATSCTDVPNRTLSHLTCSQGHLGHSQGKHFPPDLVLSCSCCWPFPVPYWGPWSCSLQAAKSYHWLTLETKKRSGIPKWLHLHKINSLSFSYKIK